MELEAEKARMKEENAKQEQERLKAKETQEMKDFVMAAVAAGAAAGNQDNGGGGTRGGPKGRGGGKDDKGAQQQTQLLKEMKNQMQQMQAFQPVGFGYPMPTRPEPTRPEPTPARPTASHYLVRTEALPESARSTSALPGVCNHVTQPMQPRHSTYATTSINVCNHVSQRTCPAFETGRVSRNPVSCRYATRTASHYLVRTEALPESCLHPQSPQCVSEPLGKYPRGQ